MTRKHPFAALALAAALTSPMTFAQDAQSAAAAPEATPAADAAPSQDAAPATAAAQDAAPQDPAAQAAPAAAPVQEAAAAAPAPAAAPAAGGLDPKVAAVVGTPPEGKAHVVFFRPSKFVGAAVGFKVRENGVELGKLRNGNYFVLAVEPGEHTYVVHSETKDVTPIEAEAGETYFLTGSLSMGVMAGRPNLSPSDAAAFAAALPKLKPSKPLD